MASGRLSEALGRFESVLAREQEAGSRRAEALYGAGMLRTAPEPGLRDLAGARAHLGEFRSAYPLHERSFEAGLAIGWMEEVADLGQRLDGLRREIEDREEAAGVEKARAAAELAVAREQIAAIEARVAELEPLTKEVESLKAEVRALQEEIQKKDQALKRVKAAVVGSRARP
jgi:DNA repair exonuclease SbcCD ATPase subunit